jgi:hypothetical protein
VGALTQPRRVPRHGLRFRNRAWREHSAATSPRRSLCCLVASVVQVAEGTTEVTSAGSTDAAGIVNCDANEAHKRLTRCGHACRASTANVGDTSAPATVVVRIASPWVPANARGWARCMGGHAALIPSPGRSRGRPHRHRNDVAARPGAAQDGRRTHHRRGEPEAVYEALATQEGLAGNWTARSTCHGRPAAWPASASARIARRRAAPISSWSRFTAGWPGA